MQLTKSERYTVSLVLLGGGGLFLLVFLQGLYAGTFEVQNHLVLHTLLELISIAVSVSIFIYGWLTYPFTQSRVLLFFALTFLMVAIFDVLHTFIFPGMPFFPDENTQATIWLWMLARLTESIAFIVGLYLLKKSKALSRKYQKYTWLMLFSFVPLISSYFIIVYAEYLPILITNEGTTLVKKALELAVVIVHLGAIIFIWRDYKRNKSIFLLNLMRACFFLIFCGVTMVLYLTIEDLTHLAGHVYKVVGYFFIMKAFYYATIKLPLEHKKQTEEKLQDIESELESLFKNTDDAIFIYNLNDKVLVRRNPAFTKMFGYDEHEPLTVNELIPEERNEEFFQLIEVLKSGKSIIDYKTVRQDKKKRLIDVSMTVSPIKRFEGEILCASILRNITEQTKAQKALQEARQELQETIAQHHGIIYKFKKIDNEFIITLIDGKLLSENNILPGKLIGKPIDILYNDYEAERLSTYNERAWQGEKLEYQFELPSDDLIFLATLEPITRNGEIVEVLGNVIDITTLIKTEELLRRTEKLSVVGELAAGFAHEIRNPLTTIKGFIQLIEKEKNEKNAEYINIMLNEIDRLEMITNEFMVVAKPQVINYQMECVQAFIKDVTQFLQPQALLKNVEMKLVVDQEIPHIYFDRNQMRQVLINLYKNSMEAMKSGGMITTHVTIVEQFVSIAIADEGAGIPENLIPRLGEPFYTLKEKGTGLGLMVSKKIIDTHQGSLLIKSELNVGTTMTIMLPINRKATEVNDD
ncbi:MASE3 domain-containing protein [Halalkalibacter krulwichiae]|uniref:histidine kinase n=1 Tax=Halalkalibacter krulwichiae TaxID=199441 RepID=A0A1X9M6R3_9BACI|nr:MASE3 domain-containing protein [Halalkalibacter krulwichiae]ARK29107.1 Sporulation kinase E [Halalkalibacter krulwichiae]